MKSKSKIYNLSTASNSSVVIVAGKQFDIEQFLLYCDGDGTFSMYLEEDTGRSISADASTIKNTFYIYKQQKIYKGMQYNKLFSEYDAASRNTTIASERSKLYFNFNRFTKLYITLSGTGCVADAVINIKKYKDEYTR